MLQKLFSLLLLFLLTGQPMVWAAAPDNDGKSVLQYRDAAREAAAASQNPSALKIAVTAVLSGAVTAAGVHVWHRHHTARLREQLKKNEKEIRFLDDRVLGLSRQQAVNAQRIAEGRRQMQAFSDEITRTVAEKTAAQEELRILKAFFDQKANVARYAALYGKTAEELEAVLPAMLREDFKALNGKVLSKELFWLKDELVHALTLPSAASAGKYMQFLSNSARAESAIFLRSLSQRLGAKHILIWALVFAAGAALEQDISWKRLERLRQNPALLLSMTDQEAQELDKNPAARAVCAVIEEAFVSMQTLPSEELALLSAAPSYTAVQRPAAR